LGTLATETTALALGGSLCAAWVEAVLSPLDPP
jgi:hypothetical protein